MSAHPRQLNTLVERGVRRNTVEVKKLERTQAKSDRDGFGELLIRALQQRLNARVERDLPAKRTEDERRGEVPILLREVRRVCGVEKIVTVSLARDDERENLKCS